MVDKICCVCLRACYSPLLVQYDANKNENIYACCVSCSDTYMRIHPQAASSFNPSKPMSLKRKVNTLDVPASGRQNKRHGLGETSNSDLFNEDLWTASDDYSIAVIDTNTFITSLEKLLNLRYYVSLQVIVPRIVLHELDSLKKREDDTGGKARLAIRFIESSMEDKQRQWIRLQGLSEILPGVRTYNNDDEVLKCCLYFFQSTSKVVLITADRVLSIKARASGIAAKNLSSAFTPPSSPPRESSPPAGTHRAVISHIVGRRITDVHESDCRVNNSVSLISLLQGCFVGPSVSVLTDNIVEHISSYLFPSDLLCLQLVSRQFYNIVNKDNGSCVTRAIVRCFGGELVPANAHAMQWYVQWRRRVLPNNGTCSV